MAHNFVERMASAKAAAVHRRNRGGTTGAHASHSRAAKRAPVDRGSWEYALTVAKSGWDWARGDAVEQFRFEVYPERFEEGLI